MKTAIRGRMVAIRKESTAKINGEDVKVLYFTVADRSQVAFKKEDGTTEFKTRGFLFCKAYGRDAELINRDFGQKDANGKLISRAIYMECTPQLYKDTKDVEVTLSVSSAVIFAGLGLPVPAEAVGKSFKLKDTQAVEIDAIVYMVKDWEYDDATPQSMKNNVVVSVEDAPADTVKVEVVAS